MTEAAPSAEQTPQAHVGGRSAVAALCAVQFVDVLGTTLVIAALPVMLADLDAPASAATPVVTSYAVLFGALLMLGARLGDHYGHARVLQTGITLFGIASLVAATAPSVAALVGGRSLLGAAAALSVPCALRLLIAATPQDQARRRALAAWSATGAAAGASGLVFGGVLTDLAGWRVLFWANVPLAALLLVMVRRTAPTTPRQRQGHLDVAGSAMLTAAVAAVVTGASLLEAGTHRLTGVLVLLAGAAAVALLPAVERRASDPLLPRAAVRDRNLRSGTLASFANTATTSSAVTLATLHLQQTQGYSATAAGLGLVPFSLSVVAGASLAAPPLRRISARATASLGLAVIGVGNSALLAAGLGMWVLPLAVGVSGFGIGLSSVAATSLGTDITPTLQGTASGVLNTAAQLGTALGVAVILLIATATEDTAWPLAGTPLGWLVAAAAAFITAALLHSPTPRSGAPRPT